MKRGAHQRADCVFVGAWFPRQWIGKMDSFVVAHDLDRSKLLRRAIQEKFEKEAA